MASYDLPPVAPHKLLLATSASGTEQTIKTRLALVGGNLVRSPP